MPKAYLYGVEFSGEPAAGLRGFTDTVTIIVDSGDPGGEATGEDSFQAFMLQALREWYDGAKIKLA